MLAFSKGNAAFYGLYVHRTIVVSSWLTEILSGRLNQKWLKQNKHRILTALLNRNLYVKFNELTKFKCYGAHS